MEKKFSNYFQTNLVSTGMVSHIITTEHSNFHFEQFNVHHSMCIVYQQSITCMQTFCLMILCTSYNLMPWDKRATNKRKTQQTVLGNIFPKTIQGQLQLHVTYKNLINFRMCKACLTEDRLRSWKQLQKLYSHYISNLSSFYSIKKMLAVILFEFTIEMSNVSGVMEDF